MAGFDPMRVVAGTFGQIWCEGEWLSNFNKCKASVDIGKANLKLAGDRWERHKVLSLKGSGSVSGYKISSKLIEKVGTVALSSQPSLRTELIVKLDDPEAFGVERIRLKNVMFDNIDLANWESGKEIEEEWKFTFEEYELLDPITES